MRKGLYFCLFSLAIPTVALAQSQVLLKAMRDEMDRSMTNLKLENSPGPYFMSYLVRDISSLTITANSGALTVNNEGRSRTLRTDLRVGDYTLDNSNFMSFSGAMNPLAGVRPLAVDDNYDAIRRQLWLETDRIYKQALDTLAKKKAYLQNTVRTEVLPDFTKGEKLNFTAPEPAFVSSRARWASAIESISRVFLKQEKIQKSRVALEVRKITAYYVNSEGTVSVEPSLTTRLTITAASQADDGMPLRDFLVYTAANPDELPAQDAIVRDAQKMIEGLVNLRTAPLAEEYSGPVLFAGEAAAEVIVQALVPNLLARKLPLTDNPQAASVLARQENPYLSKVNAKVLANLVSVRATPTARSLAGKPLLGSYTIDEEGVRAEDVLLIEKGMLRNLLVSRARVKGFEKSNGHYRGGSLAPGVIKVESDKRLPMAELKKMLIDKVKEEGLPYGYVVKSILPASEAADPDELDVRSLVMSQMQSNPSAIELTKPATVLRVFPDGREELVRGATFGSISLSNLKELSASSDDDFVYDFQTAPGGMPGASSLLTLLLGSTGMPAMDYPATVITPAFIMQGIDIKKPTGDYRKPPVVDYPGR